MSFPAVAWVEIKSPVSITCRCCLLQTFGPPCCNCSNCYFLQVCNHPDLFEGRSIISAFDMLPSISIQEPSEVLNLRQQDTKSSVSLETFRVGHIALDRMSAWEASEIKVWQLRLT